MKRLWKFLIPLAIFLIIAGFLWRGLYQNPTIIPSPLINKPMPMIDAMSVNDNPEANVRTQDFLGHITVLNVWASWCESCQAEHKVLMDITKSGKVLLYGLNYKDTNRQVANDYLKKNGNPYFLDIYDPKGEIGLNLGVYGTPETFLVDQNGIIRYKYVGAITQDVWQKEFLPRIEQLSHP